MAVANLNPYTSANRTTEAPNSQGKFFSKYLEASTGGVIDPFENFIGGEDQPINKKTDLQKGGGDIVYFTKGGELMGKGKRGEQTLRGNEEKPRYGTDSVTVDFVRHGTSWTRKDLMKAAVGKAVGIEAAKRLDRWLSRMRTAFILQRLRGQAALGSNVYFAGSRGSLNLMTSSDTFTTTTIETATGLLGELMGEPIQGRKSKLGAMIANFLVFGPDTVLRGLYNDDDYTSQALHSQQRGGDNTLIQGGLSHWRGHGIFNWNAGDLDGNGPVGSFFNPKAFSGNAAIAAGTGVLTINGGGSGYTASTDYFRYFPGNTDFTQYDGETVTESAFPAASDYYLKIINHTDSAAGSDQGKWGFYRYTGTANTGALITTKSETGNAGTGAGGRLGAAVSGTVSTTLGGVTYSSTVNSEAHPVGAPVYLANRLGNVIGFVGVLGRDAVRLAYGSNADGDGMLTGTSTTGRGYKESEDYEMIIAAAVESVCGISVKLDTLGKPRGYVLVPTVYNPFQLAA